MSNSLKRFSIMSAAISLFAIAMLFSTIATASAEYNAESWFSHEREENYYKANKPECTPLYTQFYSNTWWDMTDQQVDAYYDCYDEWYDWEVIEEEKAYNAHWPTMVTYELPVIDDNGTPDDYTDDNEMFVTTSLSALDLAQIDCNVNGNCKPFYDIYLATYGVDISG